MKKLRAANGLSQRELAERMYVTRSTVARWEGGSRLPDAAMILRLAQCLDTDVSTLISAALESDDAPNAIMVDDRKILTVPSIKVFREKFDASKNIFDVDARFNVFALEKF